jgi:hypothetical protein
MLFNIPDKIRHACVYVEHICFTPPELCGDIYIHALNQWATLQADAHPTCWPKLLPAMHPTI